MRQKKRNKCYTLQSAEEAQGRGWKGVRLLAIHYYFLCELAVDEQRHDGICSTAFGVVERVRSCGVGPVVMSVVLRHVIRISNREVGNDARDGE